MIFAKNSQLRNKCLDYIDSWIYLRVIVTSEDNTLCSCCSGTGVISSSVSLFWAAHVSFMCEHVCKARVIH